MHFLNHEINLILFWIVHILFYVHQQNLFEKIKGLIGSLLTDVSLF